MAKPQRGHFRVLIIGCGQLGSRHLQAVAALPMVREIDVVDPRPEAFELGRKRLSEISHLSSPTIVRWHPSLDRVRPEGDLCIVATQAEGRCRLMREIAEKAPGYTSFLLEKIVAQSVSDYEELMDFSKKKEFLVWVNCKARAHPSHKRVKAHLDPAEPIIFSVIGGNQGLATNGIHAADLFAFFDAANRIEISGGRIDPVLHPSKRGKNVFDLSGTLHGYSKKGSDFILSFAPDHEGPAHFSVYSRRYRAIIDDGMKRHDESTPESGWTWRAVPFEADLLVSNMTKTFAMEILEHGRCDLPTLEECFAAHRFILSALQPHFDRLIGARKERCPVT